MGNRVQLLAIAAAVLLMLLVIELVRRRRLNERYALLWLFSATVILVFAVWGGLLEKLASLLGIAYPPNALFIVAVAFVILLLLSMSTSISRLQDHSRILAQRLAILEARVAARLGQSGSSADASQEPVDEHDRPAD